MHLSPPVSSISERFRVSVWMNAQVHSLKAKQSNINIVRAKRSKQINKRIWTKTVYKNVVVENNDSRNVFLRIGS